MLICKMVYVFTLLHLLTLYMMNGLAYPLL